VRRDGRDRGGEHHPRADVPPVRAPLSSRRRRGEAPEIMSQELWEKVDDYINSVVIAPDAALEAAADSAVKAQLPPVSVTPAQGKLLHLMARALGAQRILEIGTLAGYSTIWLVRALPPGGRLITIEANPMHAEIARANIEGARVSDRVDVRVGKALDV